MPVAVNDILERIRLDVTGAIRNFQHGGVDMGVLRELAATAITEESVQLFLASMANTPSRILEALLKSPNEAVLRQLAANSAFLPKMVTADEVRVRLIVAQNRKIPPQIALGLTADSSVEVRLALAHNPSIPPNVQLKLSQDPVPFVRLALLENKRLDEEFQIGLGDDRDTIVHVSTILNERLCHACMKIWAEFDEELGQLALAGRTDLTPDIVALLTKSRYPSVRLQLLRCQSVPAESQEAFVENADEEMALALLQRSDIGPGALKILWEKYRDNGRFRIMLAKSASLTDDVAMQLLSGMASNDVVLQQALALNTVVGLEKARRQLASMGSGMVHKTMLANPRCWSPEVLSEIVMHCTEEVLPHLSYRGIDCSQLTQPACDRLQRSPLPAVRALIQNRPASAEDADTKN